MPSNQPKPLTQRRPTGVTITSEEKLNPFSSKGQLTYVSFLATVAGLVLFNLIVFVFLRAQLIPARLNLVEVHIMTFYGVWFLSSVVSFFFVTNTFIKRWAKIFDVKTLPGPLRTVIRISLLSPLLSFPLLVASVIVCSAGPFRTVGRGGSKTSIGFVVLALYALSLAGAFLVDEHVVGIDGLNFRASVHEQPAPVEKSLYRYIPEDRPARLGMAVATPGLRYIAWLAADYVRTKQIYDDVVANPAVMCNKRLGYLGAEVSDCYFFNLRNMTVNAPMVGPYFALFFETQYRKEVAAQVAAAMAVAAAGAANGKDAEGVATPDAAVREFASNLVMLSNQVELLEPGPIYKRRRSFLSPIYLLLAFGSPEIPVVEFGQDAQRFFLVQKLLPVFQEQVAAVKQAVHKSGDLLGLRSYDVMSKVEEIEKRIAAIKRDPLMIAQK